MHVTELRLPAYAYVQRIVIYDPLVYIRVFVPKIVIVMEIERFRDMQVKHDNVDVSYGIYDIMSCYRMSLCLLNCSSIKTSIPTRLLWFACKIFSYFPHL